MSRESTQPLLLSSDQSALSHNRQNNAASYGTLDKDPTSKPSNAINSSSSGYPPQSVESGSVLPYSSGKNSNNYLGTKNSKQLNNPAFKSRRPMSGDPALSNHIQIPLNYGIPVQQPANSSGLPPVPSRRRADSSGDRSVGEMSALSTVSSNRYQRSNSGEYFENGGGTLSPTSSGAGYASSQPPPKPLRPPALNQHQNQHQHHGRSHTLTGPPTGPSSNQYQYHNVPLVGNGTSGPRPHPLKRASTADSSSHRRTHSDTPNRHVRQSSSGSLNSQTMAAEALKMLPDPRWGGGSGANRARTMSGGSHQRQSSFSGDLVIDGVSYGHETIDGSTKGCGHGHGTGGGSMHRRTNSEVSAASLASAVSVDQSVEPVMTNLTKSAMFKGVTNQGVVRLQLPKDNFRLLSDSALESGQVYKRQLVEDEVEYFQDYHITDEAVQLVHHPSDCQCTCDTCNHCHSRRKQLPPTYYVMAVGSSIYRRMLDEVLESKSMPCGLFFCGHHEDVRYPSIMIAAVMVAIVFVVMLLATIYVKG